MLSASFQKKVLRFKFAAGTSRGVLRQKTVYYVCVSDKNRPGVIGVGECSTIPGLSIDDVPDYPLALKKFTESVNNYLPSAGSELAAYPSIRFGLETAIRDLHQGGKKILFPSAFTNGQQGVRINGLVWMGKKQFIVNQINDKIKQGFSCIKMKVGAINFDDEIEILEFIRKKYGSRLELRVDANGAFKPDNVMPVLEQYAQLNIHSIEQPIQPGQVAEMADLCKNAPLPIALDEELIGVQGISNKKQLIDAIQPRYIILKPSLLGGFNSTKEWIDIADSHNIGWWITSALESNVGLNAIAQWAFTNAPAVMHGLGTGQIYRNNIDSPLQLKGEQLYYKAKKTWADITLT